MTPRALPWPAGLLAGSLIACGALAERADPGTDAPEGPRPRLEQLAEAPSYDAALKAWRDPEEVNAWIGAKFSYDTARALRLSETQRTGSGSIPILEPAQLFAAPSGMCVDLARFGVETLREIAPALEAKYLMIEFAPARIAGHTLRRHWIATYTRGGERYFFADSKRPGLVSGPYASTRAFIEEYARYRGREIVAFRELDSYRKEQRTRAAKQQRAG